MRSSRSSPPATPTTRALPSMQRTPRFPSWAAVSSRAPAGDLSAGRRRARATAGPTSCPARQRDRAAAPTSRPCRLGSRCPCFASRPRWPYAPAGQMLPSDRTRHDGRCGPPTGRCGRGDRAHGTPRSCSPGAPSRGHSRSATPWCSSRRRSRRLSGGHALGRAVRRGRSAGRRAQRGHPCAGRGRRHRRRADDQPVGSPDQLHRIDGIGRRLAEAAGRNLKRVVLQLSGQNPLIVLADVDLDYAVDAAVVRRIRPSGTDLYVCPADLVERSIAKDVRQAVRRPRSTARHGRPADPSTVIGPLINQWALSLMTRRVQEAVEGRPGTGRGAPHRRAIPATVLTDVARDAELASTRPSVR